MKLEQSEYELVNSNQAWLCELNFWECAHKNDIADYMRNFNIGGNER